MLLERFSFLKGVLYRVVEHCLGRGRLVALLHVEAPRHFLFSRAWVRKSMVSKAPAPFVFDADCSGCVFCERRWAITIVCCRCTCIVCEAKGTFAWVVEAPEPLEEHCNDLKVAVCGRNTAIEKFATKLHSGSLLVAGLRLVCHCTDRQACHGGHPDPGVHLWQFHSSLNRDSVSAVPPSSLILNHLAPLRGETAPDDGSSAAKGCQARTQDGRDWPPGRWLVSESRHPEGSQCQEVAGILIEYAQ